MIRIYTKAFLLFTSLYTVGCQNGNTKVSSESVGEAKTAIEENDADLSGIRLPPGFRINVFARVPDARSLCLGSRGTVFVGNRSGGKVYAVVDQDRNGVAEKVYTIASKLNTPCGVAFRNGSLYVAEVNRILRFDSIESRLDNPPAYKVVYDKLPRDAHHGWKFIAFGPDDKLYVPIGAPCNNCESDPIYATIARMNPDGSNFEIFASGVRNTVGFAWHPQTKQLWFTDNGRDNLGDNLPADELNVAPTKGMHFGFPYCHQGDVADPALGTGHPCSSFTPPVLKLGPHVAALGMRFYNGKMFLDDYRNQIFVAEHGSWNRTNAIGYRVMLIRLEGNKPVQYLPFATGWLSDNGKVTGRPVDVEVAPDGALLVSDDMKGMIYRISFDR